MVIPVAHDFICPWCWIALFQAQELKAEFGVEFEWLAYELYPKELEWPETRPKSPPVTTDRPQTPTKLELALAAQRIVRPKLEKPHHMRSHQAHTAVEYAKTEGAVDDFIETLYRAYWEEGKEIDNPEILRELAKPHIRDLDAMMLAIENDSFADRIVGFDDEAHSKGVYNVPTYFIGDTRYAEQPTTVLREAIRRELDRQ